uniref:Rad51-like C-terminal domain-containing protein n=1 Tax=Kwoniella pini CBS 10737 TaxID=1296096 RepID=A0A1B9IE54_9TREE|nr:uncharacterized protein I206_00855 [Kwoniella pini CBS 10737]OCF53550.1 hypothetical protein I206_00855 [Kwoniella pini CBS 10737]
MLLKRLSHALPTELASLIPELEASGIKTTESLIFTQPSIILNNVPILSIAQLDYFISECLQLTTQPSISGDDVQDDQEVWAGFGVRSLDDLFEGWNGFGVVEIAGPRKVGKSLLAMHAALNLLRLDEEAICTWIDTEASFSPERAKQILESMGVDEPNQVLKRLMIITSFKVEDTFEAISQLKADRLSANSAQGHADMVNLMDEIAEITLAHRMLTLIINATVSCEPTNLQSSFNKMEIKPALGPAFTFTTDITLLMQETGVIFGLLDHQEKNRKFGGPGLRALVEVIRSKITPTGSWAVYETDGIKLYDVLPPHQVDERSTRISAGLPTGPYRPIIGSLAQTLIP